VDQCHRRPDVISILDDSAVLVLLAAVKARAQQGHDSVWIRGRRESYQKSLWNVPGMEWSGFHSESSPSESYSLLDSAACSKDLKPSFDFLPHSQALGNLAFAWSCSTLITSIQSTLKEPPKAVESMTKTIMASFSSTACFYITVACTGYAALGSTVPGDVLIGFDVSKSIELIANVAVLLHMIAVVQVFCQVN